MLEWMPKLKVNYANMKTQRRHVLCALGVGPFPCVPNYSFIDFYLFQIRSSNILRRQKMYNGFRRLFLPRTPMLFFLSLPMCMWTFAVRTCALALNFNRQKNTVYTIQKVNGVLLVIGYKYNQPGNLHEINQTEMIPWGPFLVVAARSTMCVLCDCCVYVNL